LKWEERLPLSKVKKLVIRKSVVAQYRGERVRKRREKLPKRRKSESRTGGFIERTEIEDSQREGMYVQEVKAEGTAKSCLRKNESELSA
jgi:hypothetical protein